MPAFPPLIADLRRGFDALPAHAPERRTLAGPVALLAGWDARWSAASEATTLADYWGEEMWVAAGLARTDERNIYQALYALPPAGKVAALGRAVARMLLAWGGWRVPWGEVNRFQRLDDAIDPQFDDARPSVAVPFASARWGSLASFGAKPYPNTKRWYGSSGNSFVAVVEFGPRVRAVAVTAGGESGRSGAPHFDDEAGRYASGDLRRVYFYEDELSGHTERRYHPGN